MSSTDVVRERLHSDIALLTKDVEELVRAAADHAGNGLSSLRPGIVGTLESLAQEQRVLKEKSKQGAKAAMDFARDNPWSAVAIMMGAATVLGLLLWSEFMRSRWAVSRNVSPPCHNLANRKQRLGRLAKF